MTNALSTWIRKKVGRERNTREKYFSEPEPLYLPSTPRRPITPANADFPSRSSGYTTPNGPFFRLPAEIRTEIIDVAFGNMTLHVTVEFDYPPIRKPSAHGGTKPSPSPSARKGVIARHLIGRRRHTSHRQPRAPYVIQHLPWLYLAALLKHSLLCLAGEAPNCHRWHGETPGKCFLGVMGWLLSCRQAYAETIDVVYGRNAFNFGSGAYTILPTDTSIKAFTLQSTFLYFQRHPEFGA